MIISNSKARAMKKVEYEGNALYHYIKLEYFLEFCKNYLCNLMR